MDEILIVFIENDPVRVTIPSYHFLVQTSNRKLIQKYSPLSIKIIFLIAIPIIAKFLV